MKCTVKKNPTITLELDEHEAMVLAKILGNIGGIHPWRDDVLGPLWTELKWALDIDSTNEYGKGIVHQDMMLGEPK